MLLNYVLLRLGYPPMVIKSSDRDHYISVLGHADKGDMAPLSVYIANTLILWLEIGIKAAKGEDISDPDDVDKETALFICARKQESVLKRNRQEEDFRRRLFGSACRCFAGEAGALSAAFPQFDY